VSVSFIKFSKKDHGDIPVCNQTLSLERIPTRAALPELDWQFKGNHQVHCTPGDRQWFLEHYARIIDDILEGFRPIDRSQTLDIPNLDE
jgi:hypothetical protein